LKLRQVHDFSLLVNDKVDWVIDELENQLEQKLEVCSCSDCVLDMTAWALNHIKPFYHVTLMGSIYAKTQDTAMLEELKRIVAESIEKIHSNPSCGRISEKR